MQGLMDDSFDKPTLRPKRTYLGAKRSFSRKRSPGIGAFGGAGFGSGGGSSSPKGTANTVAVFDSSGDLASSTTISLDELSYLNNFIQKTTATLVDNTASSTAITTIDSSETDAAIIEYELNRGTGNYQNGVIRLNSDGTTVSWSHDKVTTGTPGVTFDVTILSGTITWSYTTTSTGSDVIMDYQIRKF
jgi:hypothetical protein